MQTLHWWRRGRAPVTHVMVHGFAGSGASWRSVIDALSPDVSVATVTLPGHGDDVPVRDGGFSAAVDCVAEAIGELPSAHLVGYSAGGRVVLGLLARGFACRGATLISAGFAASTADERLRRASDDARWSLLLRTQGIEAFMRDWEALPIFASQHGLPAVVREEQRALRRKLSAPALADAMDALSVARMPDLSSLVSSLAVPMQLVVGALDTKYVALARSARLAAGRVAVLANCGHNPLIEAPQALAGVLDEFVASLA